LSVETIDASLRYEERESRLVGRAKESTISEMVKKVYIWRKLWTGVVDGRTIMRYSLNDAAKKVHLPRKTLDDYLL